jgi:H+/Cl- antiporter ClcA
VTAGTDAQDPPPPDVATVLRGRGYHALLLAAGLIGIPVAIAAWGFLVLVTLAQQWVWHDVPDDLGWDRPAAWYCVVVVGLGGLVVGLVVARLPGAGGHVPAHGMAGGVPAGVDLPGVLLAAAASLVLGAVIGPEGPLLALGAGLAALAARRTRLRTSSQAVTLLAMAGSAAAIATVFGNPLVASVLILEVVGLAGRQVLVVLLPCIVASGLGDLVFTGLGSWSGLDVPSLAVPGLASAELDWGDLLWVVPVAAATAAAAQLVRRLGLRTARAVAAHTVLATTAVGLLVGACAGAYTVLADRTALDVVESGQDALGSLVGSPQSWSSTTLVLLLVLKGAGYGLSLGAFRGGPTFPAVFLGAAAGLLVAPLPGLGATSGIAIGMAAATASVLRLPITSVILVVLLLGSEASSQVPVVMVAAVVALVTAVALDARWPEEPRADPPG